MANGVGFWRQSSSDGILRSRFQICYDRLATTKDTYEGSQAQLTFDWQLDAQRAFSD